MNDIGQTSNLKLLDFLNHSKNSVDNANIPRKRDSFSYFPAEPLVIEHGTDGHHSRRNSSFIEIDVLKRMDSGLLVKKEKPNSTKERVLAQKSPKTTQKQFYRRKSDCSSLFGAQSTLEQKTADLIFVPPIRINPSKPIATETEEKAAPQAENQFLLKFKRSASKKRK